MSAAAPPAAGSIGSNRFWIVQAMVVGLAAAHLTVDLASGAEPSAIPAGIPVALLLVPVGYAALRYGLSGSVATAIWATCSGCRTCFCHATAAMSATT